MPRSFRHPSPPGSAPCPGGGTPPPAATGRGGPGPVGTRGGDGPLPRLVPLCVRTQGSDRLLPDRGNPGHAHGPAQLRSRRGQGTAQRGRGGGLQLPGCPRLRARSVGTFGRSATFHATVERGASPTYGRGSWRGQGPGGDPANPELDRRYPSGERGLCSTSPQLLPELLSTFEHYVHAEDGLPPSCGSASCMSNSNRFTPTLTATGVSDDSSSRS